MRDYAIRVRRPGTAYRARWRAEMRGVVEAAAVVAITVGFGMLCHAVFVASSEPAGSAGAAAQRGGVAALRPPRFLEDVRR